MTDKKEYIRKYMKKYYSNNIDRRKYMKKYMKKYYFDNAERLKKQYKNYYNNNKEKWIIYTHNYSYKDPERRKEYVRYYQYNKYKFDLKYKLNSIVSRAIRYSLKGNKNGKHWGNLVGYTCNDLIKRLKKTMPKGYNWNDYLQGKLHIDHIIPISAFNFTKSGHTDFKRCWALSNLQLLPAKENNIKRTKLSKPFQPALQI